MIDKKLVSIIAAGILGAALIVSPAQAQFGGRGGVHGGGGFARGPAFAGPAMGRPAFAGPAMGRPAFAGPAMGRPAFAGPAMGSPGFAQHALVGRPAFAGPAMGSPAFAQHAFVGRPAFAGPAMGSPGFAQHAFVGRPAFAGHTRSSGDRFLRDTPSSGIQFSPIGRLSVTRSFDTAISCIAGSSSPAGHGGRTGGAATATMMTVAGNGFRRHRDCAKPGSAATITSFESPALAGLSERESPVS